MIPDQKRNFSGVFGPSLATVIWMELEMGDIDRGDRSDTRDMDGEWVIWME